MATYDPEISPPKDLRGQGGLKNGPDTEFLLLGGNLSLVSP